MNCAHLIPKLWVCLKEGYSFAILRKDLAAGLTVSIIALPLAMALAIASGAAPERGLYTAIVAGFLTSLLGGSRFQVGGPTGAFVVIVYDVISRFGYDGLVLATLMAGAMLVVGGLLKVGALIRFIPYPVVTGFTAGIAVVLFTGQLQPLLGMDMNTLPADFLQRCALYGRHWQSIHWVTAVLGLGTLLIVLLLQHYAVPIPSFLLAMVIGGIIVWIFGLPIETIGSKFGAVPKTLSPPQWPPITLSRLLELLPSAFTIAFLAGIESLLSAMIADGMTGYRHRSDAELIAQGIANIASVSFGGIPATGAIARTITNVRSGAKTPLAGISHALFLLVFMWGLSSLILWIPLASLAAVMSVVAWNMSEVRHFRYLMSSTKSDRAILIITFVMTILVDLTVAIQVGMILTAFLFMKRMNDVTEIQTGANILRMPDEDTTTLPPELPPGVEAFQINGPFFFSVASRLKDELGKIHSIPKVFILLMRHVPAMDATAAHTLSGFIHKCRQQGTHVILAAVQKQPLQVMKQMGLAHLIDKENFVASAAEAIQRSKILLDIQRKT